MTNNQNERIMKFLQAPPEQQEKIDRILDDKAPAEVETPSGPLLMGMSDAARLLGVSRASMWRMIVKYGRIKRVELFPGSYRVRRADIEAIAAGKEVGS